MRNIKFETHRFLEPGKVGKRVEASLERIDWVFFFSFVDRALFC